MVAKHDEFIWQDIVNLTGALLSSQVVFILLGTQVCLQSSPLGQCGSAAATVHGEMAYSCQSTSRQPPSAGRYTDTHNYTIYVYIHTYTHVHTYEIIYEYILIIYIYRY